MNKQLAGTRYHTLVITMISGILLGIGGTIFFIRSSSPRKIIPLKKETQIHDTVATILQPPTIASSGSQVDTSRSKLQVTGVAPYSSFSMAIGKGWNIEQTRVEGKPQLKISNGTYILNILQVGDTKSVCSYAGESKKESSIQLGTAVELLGISGEFRRAIANTTKQATSQIFTICEKISNEYVTPTKFGYISYETPMNPSDTQLLMMDVMLASIK